MGVSFPNRPRRSTFGPTLEDAYPVENTKQQIGAGTFNPAFWTAAGGAQILPRASLIASYNGSVFVYSWQSEAWNPDGDQAHPVLTRQSTGLYRYTFASTYKDETGSDVPIVLYGARCSAGLGSGNKIYPWAWPNAVTPLQVDIDLRDSGGTVRDAPFWLEVF